MDWSAWKRYFKRRTKRLFQKQFTQNFWQFAHQLFDCSHHQFVSENKFMNGEMTSHCLDNKIIFMRLFSINFIFFLNLKGDKRRHKKLFMNFKITWNVHYDAQITKKCGSCILKPFLIGRSVMRFFWAFLKRFFFILSPMEGTESNNLDTEFLKFLSHFVLYLVSCSNNPKVPSFVRKHKNWV